MNFFLRNRILLLFSFAAAFLVFALFWPEPRKPGEIQKYYSLPQAQLESIEYSGEMQLGDAPAGKKEKLSAPAATRVEYAIHREDNVLKPKEPLYRVDINSLVTTDKTLAPRVAELTRLKKFYASALVRSIVQDWSEPDYYYILKHEAERDQEYGLKDCSNKLRIKFKSTEKSFCVGTPTQGDTRRYLIDTDKDKVLITPDFTVRRLLNNIFAQREQALYPHGSDGADLIEIKINSDALKKLPLLRDKTGGNLKLRMLVKIDGKEKTNVWHVDGLLSIKPSHAAEFAALINALRVNAPFAVDSLPGKALADAIHAAGIDSKALPTLMGAVKIKKTDKQDLELASFAFFPPGIRPVTNVPFQLDKQLIRPLDTLVVSQYNAGYISADNHPRLMSILTKLESDLAEAQKKGAEEKAKKEKENAEKK